MGTMAFQLPPDLPAEANSDLQLAFLASSGEITPWPTEQVRRENLLFLRRSIDESGHLIMPLSLGEDGHFVGLSATLMERERPYDLITELMRGKLLQVRNTLMDWQNAGLQTSSALTGQLKRATQAFTALLFNGNSLNYPQVQAALAEAYAAARILVKSYTNQVFALRESRGLKAETHLSCRLGTTPPDEATTRAIEGLFTSFTLPVSWPLLEPEQDHWNWEPLDQILAWAESRDVALTAGPLLDFSTAQLPPWLWLWERDLPRIVTFVCRFVEKVIRRYRGRIRRWHLTAASNYGSVLSLNEDELLGLTFRLTETVRQIDPGLEVLIGIAQPWGDYMAPSDVSYSPIHFADTLIRGELNLAALDMEMICGITPRGSYMRDMLECSRLYDLYAPLGIPIQLTFGYPAQEDADPAADPELHVGGGRWPGGFTPEGQADWLTQMLSLALCKPYVRSIQWVCLTDSQPHQFPHCGLFDAQGQPRPALAALKQLREKYVE